MERFTKVRNIGKGNMGACALVRNNEDGRHYVIKQVDLGKLNKKERAQSLNEAKVLSVLRHPNVINYVDSFLARKTDHLCIVMEFADGGDLGQRIKAANGVNFSEDQIVDWMIQTALSLLHIHTRHILHRDVKTQNVFLTSDGLCKLGDFGIARALSNTMDHASTFVGTPYYLSPELILEKPYDVMSDVWAFGVCMYEAMALRHPFNAGDMKGLMQKILRVQYDPLPSCYSPELRGVVSRILVKEPTQRLKLADLLRMPIVVERMRKWMAGGVLPQRYLAALVRYKLLPPGVEVPASLAQTTLPSIGMGMGMGAVAGPSDGNVFGGNNFTSQQNALLGAGVDAKPTSSSARVGPAKPFAPMPPPPQLQPLTARVAAPGQPPLGLPALPPLRPVQPLQPHAMNGPPLGGGGIGGGGAAPMPPRRNSFAFPAPPLQPLRAQPPGAGAPPPLVRRNSLYGGGAGAANGAFPAPPTLPSLPALGQFQQPQPREREDSFSW